MPLPFKKIFGALILKNTSSKPKEVDALANAQNWQTSKQVQNPFDHSIDSSLVRESYKGEICAPKKPTKIKLVRTHLENNGSIDSWTAITQYRATRLSAIIYTLKNTYEMDIETIINPDKSHFATYIFHSKENK
jgi:hypothetical protein